MPEVVKPQDRLHKPSRWSMLKASIVDRVRHHKEKKQQVDQKASTSKNEVNKAVPKSSITPEKKSIPIVKPATKESSVSTVVKRATQEPKRPIDQILVGSWNAIKQIPEKQGKGIVNIYDKLRFPKLTTEEQKVQDKVHVFLKKYQKEIGWGITGVEAATVTYGVVKGFQYLKERRLRGQFNRDVVMIQDDGTSFDMKSSGDNSGEFSLTNEMKRMPKTVRKSVEALEQFLRKPAHENEILAILPDAYKIVLPIFAVKFYAFAERHNVADIINSLQDYGEQQERMSELLQQFFAESHEAALEGAKILGEPEEDVEKDEAGMHFVGMVLNILDYPGIEQLGVRFKPKHLA